jgi:hypothetical protein
VAAGDAVRALKAAKVPFQDERFQRALEVLQAAKAKYEAAAGEPFDPPKPPAKPKGPSCAEVKAMKRQQPKLTPPPPPSSHGATATSHASRSNDGGSAPTTSDQGGDQWSFLEQCVTFLNGLTPEDVASPRARALRLALRPHLAALASREVRNRDALARM